MDIKKLGWILTVSTGNKRAAERTTYYILTKIIEIKSEKILATREFMWQANCINK